MISRRRAKAGLRSFAIDKCRRAVNASSVFVSINGSRIMERTFGYALIFLQLLIFVKANGYYTIVAPGTIQSNYEYTVSVTLHDNPEPATVKVGITSPKFNDSKTVEVAPSDTKVLRFDLPALEHGEYKLETEGTKGLIFKNSTDLNFKDEAPKLYIQTDKAVYKPGDLVQFRIVALDENTRPAKLHHSVNLGIRDGAGNYIKQLKNIKFSKGVYSGKFQLSEQPVLGKWKLDVSHGSGDKHKVEKHFDVDKYVLPKFSVDIEAPKDVAVQEGVIKMTVRSKYTYGKPLKGKATVTFMPSQRTQSVEKTVDLDGKAHLEFNLLEDLKFDREYLEQLKQPFRYYSYLPALNVLAVVTEGYTGNQQNKSASINLSPSRYNIEVVDNNAQPLVGEPFEIKAYVKKLDGSPVRDAKTTAKLTMRPSYHYYSGGEPKPNSADIVQESKIDENGMVKFTVTFPDDQFYGDSSIAFEEKEQRLRGYRAKSKSAEETKPEGEKESYGPLKIIKPEGDAQLGQDISFDVKSDNVIPYFVYAITARGKMLKHEYVKVPADAKSHKITFKPSFDMVPSAKIYAYYVKDGDLKFTEENMPFKNEFENKIEISAPEQAKPSEEVTLNIKTDPDSFVGLLGVDQSVLLLKSGNDLDPMQIRQDLSSYNTNTGYVRGYGVYPGKESGLITLTNANYPYNPVLAIRHYLRPGPPGLPGLPGRPGVFPANAILPQMRPGPPGPPAPAPAFRDSVAEVRIRKEFIENWIFDDINKTDANGLAQLSKKIPDTITSWVVTGFSLNEKTGFGMSDNPTKIRVFQPFFISTNLPYSVKRGEVIAIPIVVFNYMEKALDAEVTMENTDQDYDFTEATNDIEETVLEDKERTKRISIPSNGGQTVSFMIRPNKVGDITLKVKAITPLAGDAIHQKLKVEPEGVTHFENKAVFVNLPSKDTYKYNFNASIPADAVLDSEYLEFSAVGDLLGPTIKNIDKLVRMPYGCGEQNMVNFVPNILVLYYLEATHKDMPLVAERAKGFMESGYQRELTYKHSNGAYSAFGEGSSEPNSWLTAYVARSFIQARKYITIDPAVIEKALEFVANTQEEDGHFPQKGKLFHPAHQNELGFTAFALLTFLEDQDYANKYKPQVDKAIEYLAKNVDKEEDIYALAIAALVLKKVDHPAAEKLLERLDKVAKFERELKWWPNTAKYQSNDIEVTSYMLQALIGTEEPGKLVPIIKWLVGQRNSLGGFDSTQDTVVGLQALIKFAEKYGGGENAKMSVDFEAQDAEGKDLTKGSFTLDKENSLLLQTHVLPKATRQVAMTATGQGSSLMQLSYRYNLATKDDKPGFKITQTPHPSPNSAQLMMKICTEYQTPDELKESNMAVMEIALPSGYTADSDRFDDIRQAPRVQRVETKNSETTIVVYFDSLTAGEQVCLDVSAERTHAVAKQKPAAITVYDYYNSDARATVYYDVKSSLCDICEKDECGAGCSK